MSPHFTEPSLVFRLGTDILLGDKADIVRDGNTDAEQLWLFDTGREDVRETLKTLKQSHCFDKVSEISGINYSKGDPVTLSVMALKPCADATEEPPLLDPNVP